MSELKLIAHNLRSAHNVGSLLRTAEGLGLKKIYLTGYSPYPVSKSDSRLPHLAQKTDRQIAKTALGAEKMVNWRHLEDPINLISNLKARGYLVCGLEQTKNSQPLPEFKSTSGVVLIVGREVNGLEPEILQLCDITLEIPMAGGKESFNVVQAAAMALYHLTFVAPLA